MNLILRMKPEENYGSFEFYDIKSGGENWYASGGIWFDENKCINDYDGVFELPNEIIEKLKEIGYDTSYVE
jgi:hypothetical protein